MSWREIKKTVMMAKRSPAVLQQRGLTMIIALVVVAVLLFIAVVLLSNAFGAVATETSIREKIAAFDAAEAGINQVVDVLDQKHGISTECVTDGTNHASGSLADGGSYSWCIQYNGIITNQAGSVKDYVHDQTPILVPKNTVYAWSHGTAKNGDRGVFIEALIAPSRGLQLPSGAAVAAGDVDSRSAITLLQSGPSVSDAAIRANGNVYQTVSPRLVQGNTYAAGVDQISGVNGTNSNSLAMTFPTQEQLNAAVQNASNEANSMAVVLTPPKRSTVISGNAFIDGDVDLSSGTVLFQHGQSVFIDGNLCIRPGGHVVNDGATIWVNGTVSTAGTGGAYSVAPGSTGTLIALGTDNGQMCADNGGKYAVVLDSSKTQQIGLVYAPYGSIDLTGSGVLIGAVDAGRNIFLYSSNGGGLRYDPNSVQPIPTYDFKIVSYMEY